MSDALKSIWAELSGVTSLEFEAQSSRQNEGWNGKGTGNVAVERSDAGVMLFHEKGTWRSDVGKEFAFTNVYRWTVIHGLASLRLEHLRLGQHHPVYLFDLKQFDDGTWQSAEPHVCREDLYRADLQPRGEVLELTWTITGPSKNESIRYRYR